MNLTDFIGREWASLTAEQRKHFLNLLRGWTYHSAGPEVEEEDEYVWYYEALGRIFYVPDSAEEADPENEWVAAGPLFEAKAQEYQLGIGYSNTDGCLVVIWRVRDVAGRIGCGEITPTEAISFAVYCAWQAEQMPNPETDWTAHEAAGGPGGMLL